MNEKTAERMSRRGFLAAMGVAGAAMFVKPAAAATVPAAGNTDDLLARIQSAVGERFMVHLPHGKIAARLDRIQENRSCARVEQFTCHFQIQADCEQALMQQVYALDNKALGHLELLMLPGNPGPTRSLVATFARLV